MWLALVLALCVSFLVCCGQGGSASPTLAPPAKRFNAEAAWRLIRLQLSYGQRPAGSPQLRRLAVRLRDRLPHGRFESIPGDPLLRNVVGVIPGSLPAVVIGAHYDTLAAPQGFVGANNGAAGTAIVVQLAKTVARLDRPGGSPEIRFVLFDGEEPPEGLPEDQTDFYSTGLRGSRAYAGAHSSQVGAMVLLDYVGNRGLRLPREGSSSASVWAQVRAAAQEVDAGEVFPPGLGPTIVDDHTPFLRAGIPAVDLIDWSYPGHDLSDTLDKLSRRSVDAVGETLTRLIQRIDAQGLPGG
ncbi:MAG TPA: M28 family metallopeptidase [Solirubrobacterales bacterium]|nr:M28 family metallopeptidase [Solirubrobacterales bacterium]